jgi:chitodextrinase
MRTRRTALLIAAALVLSVAIPATSTASTRVQLTGRLELTVAEDIDAGSATTDYHLVTAHERIAVQFQRDAPDGFDNGATVRVSGDRHGGALVADGAATSTGVLASAPGWSGPRRLAVILINFTNNATKPFSRAFANAVMFTNSNSVRAYYYEQSHGAVSLQGGTFDWIRVPYSNATCQPQAWEAAARAIFNARGISLSSYTNFMYVFPATPSCAWRGMGYMPGATTWINGTPNLRTPAHELAHNFGVHHASTLRCTSNGIRVALSSTCRKSEYGDPFTTMGASMRRHDDNLALVQMGYLPTSATRTITTSGTYSLVHASAGSGVRILGIPRGNGTWFYLEYRRPYGTYFDNFTSTDPAVNGVSIRLARSWSTITQTQLIDTRPSTSTFADAPLRRGSTFRDYLTGMTISVASLGRTTASVTIKLPADTTAPTAPGSATARPLSTTEIGLTWTAGSDNRAVAGYRVWRGGTLVATSNASTRSFTDAGLTPATAYTYTVRTLDASGNLSVPVKATAATIPVDSPPSAPADLHVSLGTTTARLTWADATDNDGVTGYEVRRDGGLVATVAGLGFTDTGLTPGMSYTWTVRAIDTVGQPGPAIALTGTTDTVDGTPPSTPTASIVAVSDGWADLSWSAATDDRCVTSYEISRDGVLYAPVGSGSLTARVPASGLYAVSGVDGAGNRSDRSTEVEL